MRNPCLAATSFCVPSIFRVLLDPRRRTGGTQVRSGNAVTSLSSRAGQHCDVSGADRDRNLSCRPIGGPDGRSWESGGRTEITCTVPNSPLSAEWLAVPARMWEQERLWDTILPPPNLPFRFRNGPQYFHGRRRQGLCVPTKRPGPRGATGTRETPGRAGI